jgi:hypothetical protein
MKFIGLLPSEDFFSSSCFGIKEEASVYSLSLLEGVFGSGGLNTPLNLLLISLGIKFAFDSVTLWISGLAK